MHFAAQRTLRRAVRPCKDRACELMELICMPDVGQLQNAIQTDALRAVGSPALMASIQLCFFVPLLHSPSVQPSSASVRA